MLDIKFVRENPEIVKQNIRNKFQDSKLLHPVHVLMNFLQEKKK